MPGREGEVITRRLLDKYKEKGFVFNVTERFTGISSGDTISMFIENSGLPDDDEIVVAARTVPVSGRFHLDIFYNVTEDTEGSDMNSRTMRVGSGATLNGVYRHGGSYSNKGNAVAETIIPGGTQGTASAPAEQLALVVEMINQDNNILFEYTNNSGQNNQQLGIEMEVLEIPEEALQV